MREGRLCPPVQAEGVEQAVGAQGARPHDLGETSRADAPVHLHLPEPILSVYEAGREKRINFPPRGDVRSHPLTGIHDLQGVGYCAATVRGVKMSDNRRSVPTATASVRAGIGTQDVVLSDAKP